MTTRKKMAQAFGNFQTSSLLCVYVLSGMYTNAQRFIRVSCGWSCLRWVPKTETPFMQLDRFAMSTTVTLQIELNDAERRTSFSSLKDPDADQARPILSPAVRSRFDVPVFSYWYATRSFQV